MILQAEVLRQIVNSTAIHSTCTPCECRDTARKLLWQRESINSTAIHSTCNHCEGHEIARKLLQQIKSITTTAIPSTCNHCERSRKNYCDKGKALIPQPFIVHAITVNAMILQGNCCDKDKALIPQPKRYTTRFRVQHCKNNEFFLIFCLLWTIITCFF